MNSRQAVDAATSRPKLKIRLHRWLCAHGIHSRSRYCPTICNYCGRNRDAS